VKLPEQVTRLGVVIGAIVAIVLLMRFVVLPESFFSAKPHQAATVVREMEKPLRHAGVAACRECHAEQFDLKYGGRHRDIAAKTAMAPRRCMPPTRRPRQACRRCRVNAKSASPVTPTTARDPTASRRSIPRNTGQQEVRLLPRPA